jgi:hypothetical protein
MTSRLSTLRVLLAVTTAALVAAGCSAGVRDGVQEPTAATQRSSRVQEGEFTTVTKDGIEIACPTAWSVNPGTDPRLVFQASRLDTIRITVGVLDALPQSYYDALLAQGTVTRTTIAGQTAYQNELTYTWGDNQLTSKCITIVQGNKACHIMFLCDTSALDDYGPVADYVAHSVRFIDQS